MTVYFVKIYIKRTWYPVPEPADNSLLQPSISFPETHACPLLAESSPDA